MVGFSEDDVVLEVVRRAQGPKCLAFPHSGQAEAVMLLSVLALDPPSAALLANSKVDGSVCTYSCGKMIMLYLVIHGTFYYFLLLVQPSSKSENRAFALEVLHLLPDVMAAKTKDADLMVRDRRWATTPPEFLRLCRCSRPSCSVASSCAMRREMPETSD